MRIDAADANLLASLFQQHYANVDLRCTYPLTIQALWHLFSLNVTVTSIASNLASVLHYPASKNSEQTGCWCYRTANESVELPGVEKSPEATAELLVCSFSE